MDQALELLPADYWRWHLTAYGPEHSDAAFTWEQFQSTTNKDLADVLGNFVNRIVKFTESKFDGVVPEGGEPGPLEEKLAADIAAAVARVKATQAQRDALARHAALAQGTRGFVDKAFRLGEADGPTRLRVELEAAQAERQLARARIDAAAAISHLRQALGLLPQ